VHYSGIESLQNPIESEELRVQAIQVIGVWVFLNLDGKKHSIKPMLIEKSVPHYQKSSMAFYESAKAKQAKATRLKGYKKWLSYEK
jgi:hypothetical protein